MLWSPAIYIPLFEQNGFVISLDYYVYAKTFQWLQKYSDTLPEHFQISLNVSPLHFEQPQIRSSVVLSNTTSGFPWMISVPVIRH